MADWQWVRVGLHHDIHFLTGSFPCQPWSSMAHRGGTSVPAGKTVLELLQFLRVAQPMALLLENVAGFRSHKEFQEFLAAVEMAGYETAFSTVHDLEQISYTSRRRYLAVLLSTAIVRDPAEMRHWAHPVVRDSIKFHPQAHTVDASLTSDMDQLQITSEELQTLRAFSTPLSENGRLIPTGALTGRVYGEGMLLPTITASYRSSINFAPDFLRHKVLLAWMVRDCKDSVRWLSALECAHALLFPQTTVVPWDETIGTFLVGNAISPAQAALMLSYLDKAIAKQMGCPPVLDFRNLLASIRASAGTCDGKVITRLDNGCWTLRTKSEALGQTQPSEARCPLCCKPCSLPLVVACKTCFVIACEQCRTDECKPEHGRLANDMLQSGQRQASDQNTFFKVVFAYEDGTSMLEVERHPTVAHVRRAHAISAYDWFFRDGLQRIDTSATGPNDIFYVVKCSRATPDCPKCNRQQAAGYLRMCMACRVVGCQACISDTCQLCFCHSLPVCRQCHLGAAQVRKVADLNVALQEADSARDAMAWDWATRCTLPQLPQPAWSALSPDDEPHAKRSRTQLVGLLPRPDRPDTNEDGICGFIDITGKFHPLPRPAAPTTWPRWIGDQLPVEADRLWVTCNGTPLPQHYMLLPHTTYLLRLHFMLPGGTKAQGKGSARQDALIKKLASHLVSKGVPEPDSKDRAGEVLQAIGYDAVAQAYTTLDPWQALKKAAEGKIRMVKQEELRADVQKHWGQSAQAYAKGR